jgi:hypothetical protein
MGTVVFYALTVAANNFAWTSRWAAALTLLLWAKLFYYCKVD